MANRFDVAIIGLGAVGSATLLQAAERGLDCVGIDRFVPPHIWGSSHGETRITRRAIGEGLAYVPLALRSHAIWLDLEARTGRTLLTASGCLVLAEGGGPAADSFLGRTIAAAERFDIDHEQLDADAIRHRFPHFAPGDADHGCFEPGGGYLHVERCIATNLMLARAAGGLCRFGETAVALDPVTGGVAIELAGGERITAAQVVVAAGSWAGALLGEPFASLLTPTRQVMHWFPLDPVPALAAAWANGPTFIWSHADRTRDFYGFPSIDGGCTIKTANEQPPVRVTPDTMHRTAGPDEAAAMYAGHVAGRLRGVRADAARSATCLYTQSPDAHFAIGGHPAMDRVLVASPCSGHGFKHSAAIGEAIAQRLAGEADAIDLAGFALSRFDAVALPA
ncbi:N-methyl-L-tryptophan oxidase [Sphingomonas sp. Leaf4]|uniref:N-methyl-L-tryptophan oxidase n=1 Tax=Sphingomonas sp. Leaf4 TaxID=2876553 RepID=UPI001E3DBE42|nr:N-methyl-L-tryptophan oxidase [Sphingomonas sp. Leaf4]